jgi:uncharacterized protein YgiM (DUF1202 family)
MMELLQFARAGRSSGGEPPPPIGIHIGGRVIVTADSVRLRANPGTQGRILGELSSGTRLTVTDGPQTATNREWWRCRLDDGREGWVASDFLQPA